MSWSAQQEGAIKAVQAWLKDKHGSQIFRLFGFAGTGKTSIAKEIASHAKGEVCFACFTGKAALVLSSKGCKGASTIHSLIYKVIEKPDGDVGFILNPDSPASIASLIVIDECSMVDELVGLDLLSFGTKVLVLGDPAQLPPVSGAGFFTDAEPDVMLTEVHRQAADNPIIRLSMDVRQGRILPIGTYGESQVIPRSSLNPEIALGADQILVGRNATRRTCNKRTRFLKGFESDMPINGDRLICLRNNRERGLLNGGLWDVVEVLKNGKTVTMNVLSQDNSDLPHPIEIEVPKEFFLGIEDSLERYVRRQFDEFDFGYAITVHKSQGSQWPNVLLIDESSVFKEDAKRHLYTGITRAAERITIAV